MNKKTSNTLTAKQLKAIPIILSEKTISNGCKKAGISNEGYYLWMGDLLFRKEFERQAKELSQFSFEILKSELRRSIEVLGEIRDDKGVEARDRIKACEVVITNSLKVREMDKSFAVNLIDDSEMEGICSVFEDIVLKKKVSPNS